MTDVAGSRLKSPPQPSFFLRMEIADPPEISLAEAAQALGVSRPASPAFLNSRADLSA